MSVLEAVGIIVFTILCLVSKYGANAADADFRIDDLESMLCQPRFSGMVKCTSQGVLLKFGYCATYKEGEGIFVSRCLYFQLNGHNVTEPGYIRLPNNITELNDCMCGPMNRKGLLCKDCIDGFGPSVTSLGYKCSNCTDVWYGIPLYLAVELIPITLFYLIILIFKVHLTSAPMVLFILYCHLIMYEMLFGKTKPMDMLLSLDENSPFHVGVPLLLGIWNLDFVRYIVPPFCVSSRLLPTHIELLDYSTIFYPLLLIFLTCICIKLHDRNFRPLVWLWRPLLKCFTRLQRKCDTQSDIIDVFGSFFLLFYVKLLYLGSALCRSFPVKHTLKGINKHVNIDGHFSRPKYVYLVIPIIFVFNMLPTLLLVLYPFKLFRRCLSKCKLDRLFITMFVEKFYSCFKDGLDGGRDMRSFSGLYFLLILLVTQVNHDFLRRLKIYYWLSLAFIFLIFALLIALVQPYKKKCINILDSLLLAHLTTMCLLLSRDYFPSDETQLFIVVLFPIVVFGLLVIFKLIAKCGIRLSRQYKGCCKLCKKLVMHGETVNQSSRQLVNPTSSFIDIRRYGTFSEISIQ